MLDERHAAVVGPDGQHRSARIALPQPPIGQPSYTADQFIPRSPVTFDANDFAPGEAVGPVTYTWRFQKDDCGAFPCTHLEGPQFEVRPVYGDPVPGAVASHAWGQSGNFYARVEATDSADHMVAHEFIVSINSVAPTVTLARDCALQPVPVACNNYPFTVVGDQSILFGGVSRWTALDRLEVRVDWGDGTGNYQQSGAGGFPVPDSPITLDGQGPQQLDYLLNATHTYTKPGSTRSRSRPRTRPGPRRSSRR